VAIELTTERRERLAGLGLAELRALLQHLRTTRAWP
jgi:hypothetical protein